VQTAIELRKVGFQVVFKLMRRVVAEGGVAAVEHGRGLFEAGAAGGAGILAAAVGMDNQVWGELA
jgi:hypothetical protein